MYVSKRAEVTALFLRNANGESFSDAAIDMIDAQLGGKKGVVGRVGGYGLVASINGPLLEEWRYSWDTDNDLVVGADIFFSQGVSLSPQV